MHTRHHSQWQSICIKICSVSSAPNDTIGHAVDSDISCPYFKWINRMQSCSQLTNYECVSTSATEETSCTYE